MRFGLLPQIHAEPEHALDVLDAYVSNYIREEIQQEALVRSLDSFARFLEIATLMNGQIVNVAGLARDAAVARPTVQGYFEVLVDTLTGFWLPAWQRRAKVKEVASPKFYLFEGLLAEGIVQTGFGVYTGTVELKDGRLRVLPLPKFLKLLTKGDLFP